VIAQEGGPTSHGSDSKTIQGINEFALSPNGAVAYIAQMSAPDADRGRVALFLDDKLIAETGEQFNRRLVKAFRDVLGFSSGGTLYFLATSTDPQKLGEQPRSTFSAPTVRPSSLTNQLEGALSQTASH
jgi:hypothetical protein